MTLNRNKLLAENAALRAELDQLKKRYDTRDLQMRILLNQAISLQKALAEAGLEVTFESTPEEES